MRDSFRKRMVIIVIMQCTGISELKSIKQLTPSVNFLGNGTIAIYIIYISKDITL